MNPEFVRLVTAMEFDVGTNTPRSRACRLLVARDATGSKSPEENLRHVAAALSCAPWIDKFFVTSTTGKPRYRSVGQASESGRKEDLSCTF